MGIVVTAVYEKGVLRPLKPLRLEELEVVTIEIKTETDEDRLIRDLISSRVITGPPGQNSAISYTVDERIALAERIAKAAGRNLSDLIIEERQDK